MSPLARIRDLTVTWPGASAPALDGVTLDLIAGEKLAVIGESGSGKSTLARAIAGLLPPGTRIGGGIDWTGPAPRAGSGYGYVFQDPSGSLDPVLSIGAQLTEVIRSHLPLSRAMARQRAKELLCRMQIPEPAQALRGWPHQFSGGQKQRIAIALAMAADPHLLIADEATSALDMLVQAEIVTLLDRLVRERAMTLIFVTHDIALAARLADRIAVLHQARLVEIGPAEALIHRPSQDYTRHLLAAHLDLSSCPLVGPAADRPPPAQGEAMLHAFRDSAGH